MYDSFYASVECPHCGKPLREEYPTKLRSKPNASYFTVGDRFEFDMAEARASGYFVLERPAGDTVRIGQVREDSTCGHWPGWAEVVIERDVITSIRAIVLDAVAFDRLHLIDDEAGHYIAAALGAEPYPDFDRLPELGRAWLAEDPAREL
ncbi:MAG TPA: hypothetical protein VGM88_33625 [Kofleriaceae bacterium]|jgi:hypothetical protein